MATFTHKKFFAISSVAAVSAVLAVSVLVAPAAQSYPPGTAMSLKSSAAVVKAGTSITLTVSKVAPGASVTIDVAGAKLPLEQTKIANGSGVATFTGALPAGRFSIMAKSAGEGNQTVLVTGWSAPQSIAAANITGTSTAAGKMTVTWKTQAQNTAATGWLSVNKWVVTLWNAATGTAKTTAYTFTRTGTLPASVSYTFSGLKKGAKFYVTVQSVNAAPGNTTSIAGARKLTGLVK